MLMLCIIFLVLFVVGFVLLINMGYYSTEVEVGSVLLMAVSGIGLILCLIIWPLSYYNDKENIRNYYSLQATIDQARKSGLSEVERAAVLNKIIDMNAWLANAQYQNHHFFGDMVPGEVDGLKPLQ